jgi:hypothetical protein
VHVPMLGGRWRGGSCAAAPETTITRIVSTTGAAPDASGTDQFLPRKRSAAARREESRVLRSDSRTPAYAFGKPLRIG